MMITVTIRCTGKLSTMSTFVIWTVYPQARQRAALFKGLALVYRTYHIHTDLLSVGLGVSRIQSLSVF